MEPVPPRSDSQLGITGEGPEIDAAVTRVYLAVVRHPEPTRSLLVAQGMKVPLIDRALVLLADRGLLRMHSSGRIEVNPPDIALPALAQSWEEKAHLTRSASAELAQVYFQARVAHRSADRDAVLLLTSLEEVAAATAEAVAGGSEQVRSFRAPTPRTEAIFASPEHSHEQRTTGAGGVVLDTRTVYDTRVLEIPDALSVLEARERGGERFRFTTAVPFSAVIVDDTTAVVDVSGFDPTGFGSALIRTRSLVLALTALAEHLWDLGSPFSRGGGPSGERRDQTILSLLAAGAPDATIARQTGVSQRTVERRVRALMDQLGAGTRFQAGVHAARRGLI